MKKDLTLSLCKISTFAAITVSGHSADHEELEITGLV